VKDWLQIYVIYFLIGFKMNKIILLFFTFSGICKGFAQKPAEVIEPASVQQKTVSRDKPGKNDSVAAKEKPFVRLFPNPAKNKVELEIKGFEPGYVQIQLLDNNGKLVREDKRLVFGGNEIIVLMFSQSPGLYFLLLKQHEKKLKTKLVIQ
jgi:Secretion system C-terminal sorting domain